MKKQDVSAPASKLAFNKEKIASLSSTDLDQIQGGKSISGIGGYTGGSTHNDFTCCACTTLAGDAAE